MTAQDLVNTVKRYLRTENLPYTDADLALFVGEALGMLTEMFDVLVSVDLYNTTKGVQSFTLPSNFKKALSVHYRPSATATVSAYSPTTKIITTSQNLTDRGWDEKGTLLLGTQELDYKRVDNTTNQIELLETPNPNPAPGQAIRELKNWIELEEVDPSEAILANPKPYKVEKLVSTFDRAYSVAGRTLYIKYPIEKTGAENLRVECIVSHPVVGSSTDVVFIPGSWKELAALYTAKRVLESWMGEEAGEWLMVINRELERKMAAVAFSAPVHQHRGSGIRRLDTRKEV